LLDFRPCVCSGCILPSSRCLSAVI
jgi:hypothetical protein